MTEASPYPDVVLLDGVLVPREQATVSAFDRGVMYGESLFETIKVVEGRPCLWERHSERLGLGCAELGLPLDQDALRDGVARLLEQRPVSHGVLRIQVTGGVQPGGGRGLTAAREGRAPRVVASVAEASPTAPSVYESGVKVVSAPGFVRPSPWLKSGNYLASVRAKAHAETLGAFECLVLSGEPPKIVEGSFCNVLMCEQDGLVCPPEGDRLPGVTLGVVLEAAAALGFRVTERAVSLDEARGGGLLLTGSLLGVCPCSHLDGEPLADSGSVAAGLRAGLAEYETRSLTRWRPAWTATM